MTELRSPIASWPRWSQALVSLLLTYVWVYEKFLRVRQPDAPQEAYIITLVIMIAVFIAAELLRPKPKIEDERPKNLGDFRTNTATQGRPVPLVFGTIMQEGANVVWYGDLFQEALRETVKTGMFSSTTFVKGFNYHLGFQFGLCRGQTGDSTEGSVDLLRILIGEKEAFSGTLTGEDSVDLDDNNFFGGELGTGGLSGTVRWFPGTPTQAPSDYLSDFQDVDPPNKRVSRYIRSCYAVFEGGLIGTATQLEPWKFEIRRITNGLGLAGNGSVNDGNDMNPMNLLFELLTDTEWGLRQSTARIDTAALVAVAGVLASEGNGISMIIDNGIEGLSFLNEIERQIDGFVFQDPETGKWTCKLARDDYDINTIPLLDGSNLVDIADYSQGTWEQTVNQARASFSNRLNDYADDFGAAFDGANAQIQGGGTTILVNNVPMENAYPGVKDPTLAAAIASRDLRTLSTPLAKGTFKVTHDLYDLKPADVFKWTDIARGITELVMRVQRIDYGTLTNGIIQIDAVQDVFRSQVGSFAPPPATGWVPPSQALVAFPTDEQFAIEAPRGIRFRDPRLVGLPNNSKLWCGGRRQVNEAEFRITERNDPVTPSGAFFDRDGVAGFMIIGTLTSDLESGTPVGTTSFIVSSTPDTQSAIEGSFIDNPDVVELGTDLLNIILIEDEFMLVTAAADSGGNVNLTGVYRGVLDSAQVAHAPGAEVFIVFVGAGLANNVIAPTSLVEVRLLPSALSGTLASASANQIALTMDRRLVRPYCPSRVSLNNVIFDSTAVSLDFLASGADETTGVDLDFIRRDFRTGAGLDEIPPLSTDAAAIFADFPSANSYTSEITVRNDPDGANTLLFTLTAIASTQQDLLRILILEQTDGVVPSRMRIELRGRHDFENLLALLSRNALIFDFDTVSAALAGNFVFGARAIGVSSNLYTVDAAGVHSFTLSSTSNGDVEISINSGGFVTLIAAGLTTGATGSLSVSDTIVVRHQGSTGLPQQLDLVAPGAGTDGFFILR